MDILLYKDGRIVCADNPLHESLDNLAMIASNPQDGDTLKYDSSSGTWINGAGGGDFNPTISNPQNGDTLVYNSTSGKWENGSGGGGGGLALTVTESGDTYTLDHTWQEIHDALAAGQNVVIPYTESGSLFIYRVASTYIEKGSYGVVEYMITSDGTMKSYETDVLEAQSGDGWYTDSANGYPSITVSNNQNAV